VSRINLRYILLSMGCLLTLSGLFGCRLFLNSGSPTPTPLPPAWFTAWLHDPVCQPPCWEGITPGTTTMTETVKILQSLPGVKIDDGPTRFSPHTDFQLEWSLPPASPGGGMAWASDNGIINQLSIGGDLSTPLQKVIDSYGLPDKVFITSCDVGRCVTNLIYMHTGMMVDLFLDWDYAADSDVTIAPDSEVRGIRFFVPGEKGFLDAFSQYSESFPRWSSPWNGYGKYAFSR
jgi:hypothetical protein